MIDPKLLTEENGFVEGVVVEIVDTNLRKSVHYFKKTGDADGLPFVELNDWTPAMIIIDSIRPLTGPMAIWNFAPIGAVAMISDVSGIKLVYADDYKHDNLVKRPFWAKENK